MRDLYIQSLFNQYMGLRDQARADLEIYLTNATGVGDHSAIGETIKAKLEEVEKYDSLVSLMRKLFSPSPQPPETPNNDT